MNGIGASTNAGHYHDPPEHTVNGHGYTMEEHFVNTRVRRAAGGGRHMLTFKTVYSQHAGSTVNCVGSSPRCGGVKEPVASPADFPLIPLLRYLTAVYRGITTSGRWGRGGKEFDRLLYRRNHGEGGGKRACRKFASNAPGTHRAGSGRGGKGPRAEASNTREGHLRGWNRYSSAGTSFQLPDVAHACITDRTRWPFTVSKQSGRVVGFSN